MTEAAAPTRIFLDSGVITQGCVAAWGSAKAVLILATFRKRFTVVLGEDVEREVQDAVLRYDQRYANERIASDYIPVSYALAGWLSRVHIERWTSPSRGEILDQAPRLLPAIRHVNDLPIVVTALHAKPDWVISANQEHWNPQLAERTGLRIVSPTEFLHNLWIRGE